MFSFPNIVFKYPVALIRHLFHKCFRLKYHKLYVTLLQHYMVSCIRPSSGTIYLAKIVALLCQNFVSRVKVIFPR
jgi:hypothetical protein